MQVIDQIDMHGRAAKRFVELELGDLSLDLIIGPRLGDGGPHGRFVPGDARGEG